MVSDIQDFLVGRVLPRKREVSSKDSDESQGAFGSGVEVLLPDHLNFSLFSKSQISNLLYISFLMHDYSTAFGPKGMTSEA